MTTGVSYCNRYSLRAIPLVMVMGIIFYFSHQPADSLQLPKVFGVDKLLHALVYGGLATTGIFTLQPLTTKISGRWLGLGVVFFCFLYGVSDEFHQSFIPSRFASGWDLVADTIGAMVVVSVWGWKFAHKDW